MVETLISTGPLEVISNRHAGNAKRPEKPPFPGVQGYFHGHEGPLDCWKSRAARWYFETSSDQAINKSRNRARTIQLQNAELFGRFFERLPTGGDARHKGLARLAL
jgi:hypothetical protein